MLLQGWSVRRPRDGLLLGLQVIRACSTQRASVSRREVPTKTNLPLQGLSILIVDGLSLSAAELSRLTALGAKVHVVPHAASAVILALPKRLDIALIGYRTEECSAELRRTLEQRGVPFIQCASAGKQDHLDYQRIFSLALAPAA